VTILPLIERASVVLSMTFFLFLPFELWARWKRRELLWVSVREMLASASPFLPTALLGGVTMAFIVALLDAGSSLAITRISTTPISALACFLVCDLLYYVDHRMGHRVRLYWAVSHSVHHSSPQYDQTTALRVSAVDGYTSPWFQVPAVLVGFEPALVLASFGFIIAYQQWIHTESIGKLGWLEGILNTPSNHRVHHSSLPEHLDRNYGGVLVVWDRFFGTYAAETGPVVYGLTTPIGSTNPIDVHIHEARKLWHDLKKTDSTLERLKMLTRGPEHTPSSWKRDS
jgi:sterol desaturase/sphingolipid hydroxylase (fatty acid hydroxylase superfamily)